MLVTAPPARRWLKASIAANLVLLLLLGGYVLTLSWPATEATRLRNALIFDVARPADIDWTPNAVPPGFKAERLPASPRFAAIVSELGIERTEGDWNKALALAAHLTRNAGDLGPIQADLETAHDQIVRQGKGYCADFTQVYLGLAHASGLFAREWAFSQDGFGGKGHAFIEIYDRGRARWLWLDVYNNVHAVDERTGEPLSAAQFKAYVAGERSDVSVARNGPGRIGYKHNDKLIDYYRSGAAGWYLWSGNAVFSYDANRWVRMAEAIAMPAGQLVAIAVGVHPRIAAVASPANAVQLERMGALRMQLYVILGVGIFLFLVLIVQVVVLARERSHRRITEPSGTVAV